MILLTKTIKAESDKQAEGKHKLDADVYIDEGGIHQEVTAWDDDSHCAIKFSSYDEKAYNENIPAEHEVFNKIKGKTIRLTVEVLD